MTLISKIVNIDKLDSIVNEYNNTYHRAIKRKPVVAKDNSYIDSSKEVNDKYPKFQVGDHARTSKFKIFLLKNILQISLKKFLWLNKLKIQFHGHMLLMTLKVKKLLELFMKKNFKRLTRNNLEKSILNYMSNGKDMIILLIIGFIKKI